MKSKKKISRNRRNMKQRQNKNAFPSGLFVVGGLAFLVVLLSIGIRMVGDSGKEQVFASTETAKTVSQEQNTQVKIPSGLAGVISGLNEAPREGRIVERIGTSCEEVIVGQRVQTVSGAANEVNVSSSMESAVNRLENQSANLVQTPKMMSDDDYETLLALVEAEATGEDLKGKVLIANVVMNRVKSDLFPSTVSEVIWDDSGGAPQFSPTYDGRIGTVVISDETREAVKQALNGVDYSQGALYFIAEEQAESENVSWFKTDMKFLFRHGNHDFYTYPEKGDAKEVQEKSSKDKNTVEMVKNDAGDTAAK